MRVCLMARGFYGFFLQSDAGLAWAADNGPAVTLPLSDVIAQGLQTSQVGFPDPVMSDVLI